MRYTYLKPSLHFIQRYENLGSIIQEAHHFNPVKQVKEQEAFHKTIQSVTSIYNVHKVLTPIHTCILQVFSDMVTNMLVEIKDFGIEFSGVIDSTYVAMQGVHCLKALDDKFLTVF